jgi:5'-3' exonuclease
MSRTILVDCNSVGRAAHSATKLTVGTQQTQAVFGTIRSIRDALRSHPGFTPVALWDERAQWRFDLHPDYKGKRNETPEQQQDTAAYKSQTPFIERALHTLGVRQMRAANYEADDLAGFLVAGLTNKPENEIILITGDKDWAQLIRPNVTWNDHRNDSKMLTVANLFERTGYRTPMAFLEGKVLQGDDSDGISGVGGIGKKGAPEFLAEFGSVRNFLARCDSGDFIPKKKAHVNLASKSGRALLLRNFKLMQLLKVAKPSREALVVDNGAYDEDAFRALCEELCFLSIIRNADTFNHFVAPFKALAGA